mmetsp:Transcript_39342/g.111480  ORF Transcript_39342/g.111480 Transcript_39342/m.111480 type:complete len:200 (+) Transcript_39342:3177-3776(+)
MQGGDVEVLVEVRHGHMEAEERAEHCDPGLSLAPVKEPKGKGVYGSDGQLGERCVAPQEAEDASCPDAASRIPAELAVEHVHHLGEQRHKPSNMLAKPSDALALRLGMFPPSYTNKLGDVSFLREAHVLASAPGKFRQRVQRLAGEAEMDARVVHIVDVIHRHDAGRLRDKVRGAEVVQGMRRRPFGSVEFATTGLRVN